MSEQAVFTLGEAAKAAGVSKGTISKALKSGRLSARSKENNQFQIDAAELFRVFPKKPLQPTENERLETPAETVETPVLRAKLEAMEARLADKESVIEDLRQRLDDANAERRDATTRLTAILTDQRTRADREAAEAEQRREAAERRANEAAAIAPRIEQDAPKGFWARLMGSRS